MGVLGWLMAQAYTRRRRICCTAPWAAGGGLIYHGRMPPPALLRCACVVLLWLVAGAAAAADSVYFEAVGDAASIPDGVVTALREDRAGLLWIGTTNGLIRYDGYRLRRYAHQRGDPSSLASNLVRSLGLGSDGRLWIGTDADGLSVFDPRSERFTSYRLDGSAGALNDGAIYGIVEAADGRLWICSRGGGLDRFDPADGSIEHFRHDPTQPGSLPDDRVNALLLDRDGALWLGTWTGLLRRDPDGRFERVFSDPADPDSLAGRAVYALFQAADGRLWVGTREGDLALIEPETGRGRSIARASAADAGGTASVFAIVQVASGELWLGRANGIEVRDSGSGQLVKRVRHDPAVESSLRGNDVRTLLIDRAGLLWAGGFGSGLQRHDPGNQAVRVYRHQTGFDGVLAEPNIVSILPRANGELWLGTRGNGVAVLDRQMQLVAGFHPQASAGHGLEAGWITALAETRGGQVWLGSRNGLWTFDDARQRFRAIAGGGQSVRRLLAATDDRLWVGTGNGLYRAEPGAAVVPVTLADGEPLTGDVNALAETADGALWVGGVRGLYRIPAGGIAAEPVRSPSGHAPGHPSVLGLLVDRDGVLWLDTAEGLHRLRGWRDGLAEFEAVSVALGIAGSDFGANLLQDAGGRIWSHRRVYDPADGSLHELTRTDGVDFGTGWFRAYARGHDGRLLFGGSEGLLAIDPARFRPWAYAPPLVISELKIDGRAVPADPGALQLPATARSFSLEFAALDYSAPERLRYQYRLEPFDRDWIDTDASHRVASYSNLWPGDYRLRVRGSNRNGEFSAQELQLPVRVQPAWWQTPWAALAAALLLALAVIAAVRLRTATIARRAQVLQLLVDERTAELSLAKQRAEAALLQLQGAQNQLVVAEKMASLGQLVAGVAHEINTPIGIAVTAASHLQETTRDGRAKLTAGRFTRGDLSHWQDTVEEASRLILGSLQRAHTLIGSFKRVAVDQSSEQRRRFALREFLGEVQFALQPSYRRGPHVLMIDCLEEIELDTYPGALFQILTNLVTNSLTHAFVDGRAGQMLLQAERDGDMLQLRYRDDGVGMPADIASRAFDPFFTTRRGDGGSGLGLHLVYNLTTQLLRGSITLSSTPGHGTEFVIRMPVRLPGEAVLADEVAIPAG
jgi:ligand-binding sensor domain-containing protein/signal transduction histidine kinase